MDRVRGGPVCDGSVPASCPGYRHGGMQCFALPSWQGLPDLIRGLRPYDARLAGNVSGATAPPEMMKAIAWSIVQSVEVTWSSGTTTR